jgi:hypothetical protein
MTIITEITNELKTRMEDSSFFPFSDRTKYPPSKQFKPHMKNVALKNNPIIMISPEIEYFELGNEYAEEKAPQYHILEDARKIKNPNMGTPQTLGTQRNVKDRKKRDYGKMTYLTQGTSTWRGQEYRQSFRGRSNIWKENLRISTKRFEQKWNKKRGYRVDNTFRYNEHFGYIERILEDITPRIAQQVKAKLIIGSTLFETYTPIEGDVDLDEVALYGSSGYDDDSLIYTMAPLGE